MRADDPARRAVPVWSLQAGGLVVLGTAENERRNPAVSWTGRIRQTLTFSDAITLVRRHIWQSWVLEHQRHATVFHKPINGEKHLLLDLLTQAPGGSKSRQKSVFPQKFGPVEIDDLQLPADYRLGLIVPCSFPQHAKMVSEPIDRQQFRGHEPQHSHQRSCENESRAPPPRPIKGRSPRVWLGMGSRK